MGDIQLTSTLRNEGRTLDSSLQEAKNPDWELTLSSQGRYSVRRNRIVSGGPLTEQDPLLGDLISLHSVPSGPVQLSSVETIQRSVGEEEGLSEGDIVGALDGTSDGTSEGIAVGPSDGSMVGEGVTTLLETVSMIKLFQKSASSVGGGVVDSSSGCFPFFSFLLIKKGFGSKANS